SDKIGAFAGVSGRTIEKIAAVCDAARAEPARFGHLLNEMDRYRRVDRAYRALHRAQDEARVLGLAPHAGKFPTLIVDPGWPPESVAAATNIAARGNPQYALMTADQILALPVPSWAEDDCHLYLWATNSSMPLACECLKAWGFTHKSVLT